MSRAFRMCRRNVKHMTVVVENLKGDTPFVGG
jgi:hypothetical protein